MGIGGMISPPKVNIAARLRQSAELYPERRAIVVPVSRKNGRVVYREQTFRELELETNLLAHGLRSLGVHPGTRIVLMVRPGIEFIALTFALFKTGAVVVLIDPGMGGRRIFDCLDEVEPEGFVAIPLVHAIRWLSWRRFRKAKFNVAVGPQRLWPGPTYAGLLQASQRAGVSQFEMTPTRATDSAAVIFTSGSTGPPKGVAYEHGMFAAQADWIRDFYNIQPGEIDLPGFPLFGLYNAAMGVTTVIPDMNPARPAQVDPRKILEAIEDQQVTQSFGSPAIWNRVSRYCLEHNKNLGTLKRVLSAGAPVPVTVLKRMSQSLRADGAEMYTPYGATESLPVCSISATEVLQETAARTADGAGTCVGKPFPQIRLAIIAITDGPIRDWSAARQLPAGEIGEIVVQGDVVTREYFRRPEATAAAKIPDGDRFWHRIGDVGYLDDSGRLWFCGRKSHIVWTNNGPMYTDCVEPIFNVHPAVSRSALVGVGPVGTQRPVMIIEPEPGHRPADPVTRQSLLEQMQVVAANHPKTHAIRTILFHESLPVDIRHNVKINREALAVWAAAELEKKHD